MEKKELILAALAPARQDKYTPVQVQKLFFLIDQNISKQLGGKLFKFKPYHYGPFDKAVYEELYELSSEGFVEIFDSRGWNNYRLSEKGQKMGKKCLDELPSAAKKYLLESSKFVRSLSFTQLVSAIYKAYPKMKKNSVFVS